MRHGTASTVTACFICPASPITCSTPATCGRPGRYVPPARFYVLIAIAYIAVNALVPGHGVFVAGLGFTQGDDFIQVWTPRVMLLSVPFFAAMLS